MGACPPNDSTFIQAINKLTAQAEYTQAQGTIDRDKGESLQQGGMQEVVFNLAVVTAYANSQVRYESSGTWLYLSKSGTTPGTEFTVEMAGGKSFTKVVPGTKIVGKFNGCLITVTGVLAGTARFVIGQSPNVDYDEENISGYGNTQSVVSPPVTPVSVAYNTAANSVYPAAFTTVALVQAAGGVSLQGATAVRCRITSPTSIVACAVRFWYFDPLTAKSYLSNQLENLPAGPVNVVSADYPVGVKQGYVFAEVYGNTNTGATGAFTFTLEAL